MSVASRELQEEKGSKEKIFNTAARLFAEKGYNGVSMREISEKTGLSKPTIYYYFGSKEGIYKELIHAGLSHGTKEFEKIINQTISIKQKLIEIVKIRFKQGIEYPEYAKFILSLFIVSEKLPFLDKLIEEAENRRLDVVTLVQEGINNGEFGQSADPDLAAEIFLGTIIHYLWKQVNSQQSILSDQLAEEIVELLFKGLNE
jgi:AcrR family transcriptional regulator